MSKLNRYLVELFPVTVKSFRPLSRTALTLPSGSFISDSALCSFYMNNFNTYHNNFTVVNISFLGYWIFKKQVLPNYKSRQVEGFCQGGGHFNRVHTSVLKEIWNNFFFYINPFLNFNITHNMVKQNYLKYILFITTTNHQDVQQSIKCTRIRVPVCSRPEAGRPDTWTASSWEQLWRLGENWIKIRFKLQHKVYTR